MKFKTYLLLIMQWVLIFTKWFGLFKWSWWFVFIPTLLFTGLMIFSVFIIARFQAKSLNDLEQ